MNHQMISLVERERENLLSTYPCNDSRICTGHDVHIYVTCSETNTLHYCFHDPVDASNGYFISAEE